MKAPRKWSQIENISGSRESGSGLLQGAKPCGRGATCAVKGMSLLSKGEDDEMKSSLIS